MSTYILCITHKNIKYLVSSFVFFLKKDSILLKLRIGYDSHPARHFMTWYSCGMRFYSSQTGTFQNKREQWFQHPYVWILWKENGMMAQILRGARRLEMKQNNTFSWKHEAHCFGDKEPLSVFVIMRIAGRPPPGGGVLGSSLDPPNLFLPNSSLKLSWI